MDLVAMKTEGKDVKQKYCGCLATIWESKKKHPKIINNWVFFQEKEKY